MTIGISPKAAANVEELVRNSTMALRASLNSALKNLFRPTDALLEVTNGHCSCGLYQKPGEEVQRRTNLLAAAKIKYESMGWSDAKIERALEQKAEHADRHNESEELVFRELIASIVGQSGKVRVFAYFYSGSQDEEVVTSHGIDIIPLSQFVEVGFSPDQVVEIFA